MTSARKTCRKTRFDNEFEAEKWLKKMQRYVAKNSTAVARIPQRVYECPFCRGYHATSRKYE